MRRIEIPDGIYPDALPSGEYVCTLNDRSHVVTHLRNLPTQDRAIPLQVRLTNVGGFQFAGARDYDPPAMLGYKNGSWYTDTTRRICGINPCLFLPNGELLVATCSAETGSQGWRYVDPQTQQAVPGDRTYGPSQGVPLCEWTDIGDDLYIGQATGDCPIGCFVFNRQDGSLRVLEPGRAWWIRANQDGDQVAVAMAFQQAGKPAIIVWTSKNELRTLPTVEEHLMSGIVEFPPVARLKRAFGVGSFWTTAPPSSGRVGHAPGHFEVLTDGALWSDCADKTRPIIADIYSAPSVPNDKLVALFAVWADDKHPRDTVERMAQFRGVPVVWYSDAFPYPDGVPTNAWWMVKAYPTASVRQIEREIERLERVHTHLAVATPHYLQRPDPVTGTRTWTLQQACEHLHPLVEMLIRHPSIAFAAGFCGEARLEGMGTYPILKQGYTRLVEASEGPIDFRIHTVTPPAPPAETPTTPEEPQMKLPARGYAILHNGNIATVAPGGSLDLAYRTQEYASYQAVEVRRSRVNPAKVLVYFPASDTYFRVDRVEALKGNFSGAAGVVPSTHPTLDSGWQWGDPSGACVHFGTDSPDGVRHGIGYTLLIVDQNGRPLV